MVTRLTPILLLSIAFSSCATHRLPKSVARIVRAPVPSFEHVFVVVEENQNYADVIGNTKDMPFLNTLAARYGLATNYYANTHPSINNYFFLTAGRMGTIPPWILDLSDHTRLTLKAITSPAFWPTTGRLGSHTRKTYPASDTLVMIASLT